MNTDDMFIRRLQDLSNRSYQRGFTVYSDFLSPAEMTSFLREKKMFSNTKIHYYGGFPNAERQMIAFQANEFDEIAFPITCLGISPLQKKFAEELTHRDYLGAILNLGIERTMLGDIIVTNQTTYLFCKNSIASFIMDNCFRIRHTSVQVKEVCWDDVDYVQQYEEINGTVSSLRIDSILAVFSRMSRNKCLDLIHSEKVSSNHQLITSPHYTPKDKEIISVRGLGKFIYCGEDIRTTKKGRFYIKLLKYK